MTMKQVSEFIIPRRSGRAFEVTRGQVMRVVEIEGPQVGDMTMLNLRDFRETFSSHMTCVANDQSFRKANKLMSQVPFYNPMFTVVDDKTGMHWVHGRCTRVYYTGPERHRNCQDNIVEALAPWGLDEYQVPFGTFNIFMNVAVDQDCRYHIELPVAQKGDYIDFRAEMDLLVAISACPHEGICNANEPKPLQIQIFDGNRE